MKTFELPTFPDAIAFVTRIAERAEAADHHPDLDIRYRKVRVALSTHDAGGLTDKDFDLAAEIEACARVIIAIVGIVILALMLAVVVAIAKRPRARARRRRGRLRARLGPPRLRVALHPLGHRAARRARPPRLRRRQARGVRRSSTRLGGLVERVGVDQVVSVGDAAVVDHDASSCTTARSCTTGWSSPAATHAGRWWRTGSNRRPRTLRGPADDARRPGSSSPVAAAAASASTRPSLVVDGETLAVRGRPAPRRGVRARARGGRRPERSPEPARVAARLGTARRAGRRRRRAARPGVTAARRCSSPSTCPRSTRRSCAAARPSRAHRPRCPGSTGACSRCAPATAPTPCSRPRASSSVASARSTTCSTSSTTT